MVDLFIFYYLFRSFFSPAWTHRRQNNAANAPARRVHIRLIKGTGWNESYSIKFMYIYRVAGFNYIVLGIECIVIIVNTVDYRFVVGGWTRRDRIANLSSLRS